MKLGLAVLAMTDEGFVLLVGNRGYVLLIVEPLELKPRTICPNGVQKVITDGPD
jgi:hypothetical protein